MCGSFRLGVDSSLFFGMGFEYEVCDFEYEEKGGRGFLVRER